MTREDTINEIKSWAIPSKKGREVLETLIPELRESKDERIRREIIDFIQWAEDRGMTRHDYRQAKRPSEWIDYLEKQKEKKPIVEYHYAKFREGDKIQKITGDKDIVTIAEVNVEAKEYRLTNSGFIPFEYEHLWHIVEQKSIDNVSKEEYVRIFKALCDAYEIKLPNREYDIYYLCDDLYRLTVDCRKNNKKK